MRFGFYAKLAAEGIRKSRRIYLPYILTCIGMVMMTYIINYLRFSESVNTLNGGNVIRELMNMGFYVIAFFAVLFLFYTNSFLARRRKKEFGLYNILGMSKGSLGKIILWESGFVAVIALVFGLIGGIAFSKLAELGFVNLMKGKITYSLSISMSAVVFTVIPFILIFILLMLNSLRQVSFASAISLLQSENAGEKPPKGNWLIGILGVIILGGAYYLAVTIKDPISAIGMFLIAVLMVIIATYMIMVAGSVLMCRILQRRKNYYYRANHFVSISSMLYRMKRNGAGLASICILATMVLVMIASTSAIFIGGESVIKNRYPMEMNVSVVMSDEKDISESEQEEFEDTVNGVMKSHGMNQKNSVKYSYAVTSGMLNDGNVIFDSSKVNDLTIGKFSDVHQIYLVSIGDYNRIMGTDVLLPENEVLIYAPRNTFNGNKFGFKGLKQYRVREMLKDAPTIPDMAMDIVPTLMVVVPDITKATEGIVSKEGKRLALKKWYYGFDTSAGEIKNITLSDELKAAFDELQQEKGKTFTYTIDSRDVNRKDFYSLYGGLFYLGIILSIVFIFAAVLIIYYKQVTEGYEDQSRFEIMQKVGMTKEEIRKSINSQLLTVFFLPLIGAGLHLAFAFPIIEKLLLLFYLNDRFLFICTSAGSFLLFAIFYIIVYRITSNVYYKIVSG